MFWERVLRVTRNFDQNFCPMKGTYYANERTYMEKIPCRKILKVPDRHQGLRTLLKTLVRVWGGRGTLLQVSSCFFCLDAREKTITHSKPACIRGSNIRQSFELAATSFARTTNLKWNQKEKKKKKNCLKQKFDSSILNKNASSSRFLFFLVPEFFFFFFVKFKTSSFFVSKKAPKDFASRFFIQAKMNSKKMSWV